MSEAIHLPSFRLDDRVAMVTGSGTGIGAGIATGFAEAGADLVVENLADPKPLLELLR